MNKRLEMALPKGKTCNDCIHMVSRCSWLLSREGTEIECDWSPSRFVPITKQKNGLEYPHKECWCCKDIQIVGNRCSKCGVFVS